MNSKTMEGLVGARTNMNLMDTPMRIYKEARQRGDTATMERAMGYANEFSDKAQEYKAEADKGMEEDAREAREKEKIEREEAIRKRREEREKQEEKLTEDRNADSSTDAKETKECLLEVSEEGKVLLKDNIDSDSTVVVKEPVTYTKTGESLPVEQGIRISVSV